MLQNLVIYEQILKNFGKFEIMNMCVYEKNEN